MLFLKKKMLYRKRGSLTCSEVDLIELTRIAKSRTEEQRHVQRANIFLGYMDGKSISSIASEVGLTRQSVYEAIDKALAFGQIAALDDLTGRGAPAEISDEDKAWVLIRDLPITKGARPCERIVDNKSFGWTY